VDIPLCVEADVLDAARLRIADSHSFLLIDLSPDPYISQIQLL
jgi:hypothetical protein